MDSDDAAPAARKPQDAPASWRVDEALWAALRPPLVVDKPRKRPGRPRKDDRPIFDGLIWPARNGGQWATLPREFGAKSTVHARFLEWVERGCLARAWARLLAAYDGEVGLDRPWRAADGRIVEAPPGKKEAPARRRRRAPAPATAASAAASGTS